MYMLVTLNNGIINLTSDDYLPVMKYHYFLKEALFKTSVLIIEYQYTYYVTKQNVLDNTLYYLTTVLLT